MPDKQTTTKRWDPNAKGPGKGGYVSETTGRDLGSTTDYQDTGGLGAVAAAAAARRKKAMEEAEDPEDQKKKDRGAKVRKALAGGTGY